MRPDLICLTRSGICRMGCANAFNGHRPHCPPLLVDAISCSCKARQAHASSKCSCFGCHTASAGTMTEYVWTLSHKLEGTHSMEERMIHCRMERAMTKTMMIIVMIMMLVIDGDGHRRWWWREVDGGYVKWLLKMLHWWCAAVIKNLTKFDLHKQN